MSSMLKTHRQHVSQPMVQDEQTQQMKQLLLKDIRRSAYVYRVDCGGCNACEIEIFAAITPVFDAERFGTPLTKNAESPWKRLSDQMMKLLDDIAHEPAIYLLARKITGSGIR